MKKTVILLIISGFFLLRNIACAADADVGTTVGQFLKIGAGARATGMGEAYTALADDVYCLYWNPAGLGRVDRREFSFTYLSYIQGMEYGYLGLINSTKWGFMGGSLSYLVHDDLEGFDAGADETGEFSAKDIALSLSCSQRMTENLLVGQTLRFVKLKIESEQASGFSFDLGALYSPHIEGFTIGAAARNMSLEGMKFTREREDLPFTFQIGCAYQIPEPDINIAMDLTMLEDNKSYLSFGTEYWLQDTVAARLGYRTGPMDEGSKFTVGFGYKLGLFTIDYASEGFGDLGEANHLTFQYRF